MEKTITMLDDLCQIMGVLAEGCKTLGLISEEEFEIVHPKPTKYTYVRYLPTTDEDDTPAKKCKDSDDKRESGVTAYLSGPLIDLLDSEVTKYQRRQSEHEIPLSELTQPWNLKHDGFTGEVIKDEAFELCVKAEPLFKELVALIKRNEV